MTKQHKKGRKQKAEKQNNNEEQNCNSNKTFQYLNSRVHTRETSTLMFTTVAVSASLILLGIVIGQENPFNILPSLYLSFLNIPDYLNFLNVPTDWIPLIIFNTMSSVYYTFLDSNDWLFVIGVLIIILGIAYREITIYSIDAEDYNKLKNPPFNVCIDNLSKKAKKLRAFIVRLFFFTTLEAWLVYKYNQIFSVPPLQFLRPCSLLLCLSLGIIFLYPVIILASSQQILTLGNFGVLLLSIFIFVILLYICYIFSISIPIIIFSLPIVLPILLTIKEPK